MNKKWVLFAFLSVTWLHFGCLEAQTLKQPPVEVQEWNSHKTVSKGTFFWIAVFLKIQPHWHVYWKNPGDSGLEPKIEWETLPRNISISSIQWPFPKKITTQHLVNFGYEERVAFLMKVHIPQQVSAQKLEWKGKFSYLVCKEECIPFQKKISFSVSVGKPLMNEIYNSKIKEWFGKVPQATLSIQVEWHPKSKQITVVAQKWKFPQRLEFFPENSDWMVPSAKQIQYKNKLIVQNVKSSTSRLQGVLVIDRRVAFQVDQELRAEKGLSKPLGFLGVKEVATVPPVAPSFFFLFVLAFGIGLLLNVMPCVFPVLSLKVLHFVQFSQQESKAGKLQSWFYLLGVVSTFLFLAGILYFIRATGQWMGWGFQLQSPTFIYFLFLVTFVMSLSLMGWIEFSIPSLSRNPSSQQSLESFLSGVFATWMATPCLAPWMGVVISFALSQPFWKGSWIFFGMGFGMAIPLVLLSYFPFFLKWLPKPGIWMKHFQQAMAFPMLATSIWLLSVLLSQVSKSSFVLALWGLLGIVFLFWLQQKLQEKPFLGSILWTFFFSLVLVGILSKQWKPPSPSKTSTTHSQAFTEKKWKALLQQEKKVFLNFTADWCVSCKVNEKLVFQTQRVQSFFRKHGIVYLVGDWTRPHPEIEKKLKEWNKSGIPLYLFFQGTSKKKWELPALLTPSLLESQINQAIKENRQ